MQQQLARKILQFNSPTYTSTTGEPAFRPKQTISIDRKKEVFEQKITKASGDIEVLKRNIEKRKNDIEVLEPTITQLEQWKHHIEVSEQQIKETEQGILKYRQEINKLEIIQQIEELEKEKKKKEKSLMSLPEHRRKTSNLRTEIRDLRKRIDDLENTNKKI